MLRRYRGCVLTSEVIATACIRVHALEMHLLTTLALLLAALVHLMPLVGALGASRLVALYGVPIQDPNLALLMRHRAVLFGMLGGFLGYAATDVALHAAGLCAAWTSVAAFLLLAATTSGVNRQVHRVVLVDRVAALALGVGSWAHLRSL